jgi:chromate transporter
MFLQLFFSHPKSSRLPKMGGLDYRHPMSRSRSSVFEVFWRFLALGCMSFGGPAAHIGYFRETFVERLKWLDDAKYARLIALSQFLPGPGSSQVGFAVGVHRAGILGGFAAFTGFTLPSLVLLITLSVTSQEALADGALAQVIHGLKMLAVVVVAHASLKMFKSFCTSLLKTSFCIFTAGIMLVNTALAVQMLVLAAAAVAGAFFIKDERDVLPSEGRVHWVALGGFGLLLAACLFIPFDSDLLNLFARFYESGSLVFGGGHVVLPLLQATVGDAMETDRFLFGYAAAQAIPGPMFSVAGFLGAELLSAQPVVGGLLATAAIFLPGFLLVIGLQGMWQKLMTTPHVAGAAAGINAAVVGLLLAALYQPVFVSAVHTLPELLVVLLGFVTLIRFKPPIVWVVVAFALAGFVV